MIQGQQDGHVDGKPRLGVPCECSPCVILVMITCERGVRLRPHNDNTHLNNPRRCDAFASSAEAADPYATSGRNSSGSL